MRAVYSRILDRIEQADHTVFGPRVRLSTSNRLALASGVWLRLETLVTPHGRPSVIIIGGGPAGMTAAYRLTAQGCRVTLLTSSSILAERFGRQAGSRLQS